MNTFKFKTMNNALFLFATIVLFSACKKESITNSEKDYGKKLPCVYVSKHFSVGQDKKVYFSKGNLQYNATTDTWRFAEQQYDIIGKDNENVSSTYNGWIDLFGWGTSGWDSGAEAFKPYSTDTCNLHYNPGGSEQRDFDLTGEFAQCDWGMYNKISNGGNQQNMWRTLTCDEWVYLLLKRAHSSELYSAGKVGGMNGVIILPDEWEPIASISFVSDTCAWDVNDYTFAQWAEMEANGAVFLPAAGERTYKSVNLSTWNEGIYWSSTASTEERAWQLHFYGLGMVIWDYPRSIGVSVRLVKNAE